jgi:hypothetical protein
MRLPFLPILLIVFLNYEVTSFYPERISTNLGDSYGYKLRLTRLSCNARKQVTSVVGVSDVKKEDKATVKSNDKSRTLHIKKDSLEVNDREIKGPKKVISRMDGKLEIDITALRVFHALHGHFRVPYYYVIPDEGKGDTCDNSRIRRKNLTSITSSSDFKSTDSNRVISRSNIRQTIKRNIGSENKENKENTYPPETFGLLLGRRVAKIRYRTLSLSLSLSLSPSLSLFLCLLLSSISSNCSFPQSLSLSLSPSPSPFQERRVILFRGAAGKIEVYRGLSTTHR